MILNCFYPLVFLDFSIALELSYMINVLKINFGLVPNCMYYWFPALVAFSRLLVLNQSDIFIYTAVYCTRGKYYRLLKDITTRITCSDI